MTPDTTLGPTTLFSRAAYKGIDDVPATAHKLAKIPTIDPAKAFFRLEVRPSKIHRWGIFALEPIPARRRVIEYTGERIDNDEHDRRYTEKGCLYFFTLTDNWVIDPSTGGSGAEYINHSCDGNLESFTYRGHIYLSTRRRIQPGEELTYDYNIIGDYTASCRCGAENCRGTLGNEE